PPPTHSLPTRRSSDLYDAQADTFVLSRKDVTALTGAYAAADAPGPGGSNDIGTFVVGNVILNPALVPIGTLDASVGNTMGFAFTDRKSTRLNSSHLGI